MSYSSDGSQVNSEEGPACPEHVQTNSALGAALTGLYRRQTTASGTTPLFVLPEHVDVEMYHLGHHAPNMPS